MQAAQARMAAYYQAIQGEILHKEAMEERHSQPPRPAFDMAKWKEGDYAAGARWETQQAYLRYRQADLWTILVSLLLFGKGKTQDGVGKVWRCIGDKQRRTSSEYST